MKQAMREDLAEFAEKSFEEAEQKVEETFKAVLGTLVEEASSEIVQQELEAMGKAVVETAQSVMQRASTFTSSLAQIAEEFASVDVGRDTSKEQLNAILARYPKTSKVKG
jgi:flagellar biosynthesis/type III secretory pathway protein FliH